MADARLREFETNLRMLMGDQDSRPLVCDGSPLDCRCFIVGFHAATDVGEPFWKFWDSDKGFDKPRFMEVYLMTRSLRGVRARIEEIVAQVPMGACLETNICSIPRTSAAKLRPGDRATTIFEFLLRTINPAVVYAHSNEPIRFFRDRITGSRDFEESFREVAMEGHRFWLYASPGPLWRRSLAEAREIGRKLSERLSNSSDLASEISPRADTPMA